MNKKKDFVHLLSSPSKGVGECRGVRGFLANTWRQLLFQANVTPTKFTSLLSVWLRKDSAKRKNAGVVGDSSARNNRLRAMVANSMTWKVLCSSASILGVVKIKCTFEWVWANGRSHITYGELDLSDADNSPDDPDDDFVKAASDESPPWVDDPKNE